MCYGSYMFYIGRKRYDMPIFLGTKQLRLFFAKKELAPATFHADGRGGVRHHGTREVLPWF